MKNVIVALVVGLVIGATGAYFLAPDSNVGGAGVQDVTHSVNFIDGLHADKFSQGAGVFTMYSDAAANATVTQAILENNNVIYMNASTTYQQPISLLLPATSTWTTLLPDAGDSRAWIVDATGLAAATTTTITAGTGINLMAYTTNDDVIDGAEIAELSCYREASTDVTCITTEILAAD